MNEEQSYGESRILDAEQSSRKRKVNYGNVAKVWAIMTLLVTFYPPVAQDFHALGTGRFLGYRFIFDIGALCTIDWGILVFEWILIIGALWLLAAKTKLFVNTKS